MPTTLGLDVGGAHLKAVLVEDGRIALARQIACPLWLGTDQLDAALAEIPPHATKASRVAVTMTGELSDIFADRRDGVERLAARLEDAFGPDTLFWMGTAGFGSADKAVREPAATASMNFLATAAFVATKRERALLVDMGSTTTDIVPIVAGCPVVRGLSDGERLTTGELVYIGLTRTSLMAVAAEAPFRGARQRLCREHFATMADVRRVLGDLPDGVDQHETADRQGKSTAESVARLARLFGRDASDGTPAEWREAACFFAERQLRSIHDGCLQVLSAASGAVLSAQRFDEESARPPLVLAGIGAEALEELARRLGSPWEDFGALTGARGETRLWTTRCAPAAAVALLLAAAD